MRVVKVTLGTRSYSIHIGSGLLSGLGAHCERLGLGERCAIVMDRNVARHYGRPAWNSLAKAGFQPVLVTVPAGEKSKNLRAIASTYDLLAAHRIERQSFLVALGGGVVGDLAGYVAATYLRGIPFVHVPTTLLSQVDSSVGGKVGVNLKAGKNLVGAFHQPRFVLCDLDTLDTLPDREFRAGLAEVIKYGIIYDRDLFDRLERDLPRLLKREPAVLASIIARCCEIKAAVICKDEKESGLRSILNYGHTIGHAIETVSGYGRYLHGEAISIGQTLASELSAKVLGLPARDVARVRRIFSDAGLPTHIKLSPARRTRLYAAMARDKKVTAGEPRFVLAERIGRARWGQRVPGEMLGRVLTNGSP
ncbi:MAG: 3-dehydroquinate synthase [Verrucomicrobia bacterium]|nr:3-dehydroquinate synthase [Verrucomicrobiota bacterium]